MAMSRIGEAQLIIGDVKDGLITFEQADKTASKLKGHSKNWCLIENSIIRSQAEAQSGNGESARKTLVDAIVFADTPRADLLARIAQSQAKIGDVDGSKKTFIKSLDLAIRMKDTYEKGSNLKDLATAQAKSGDIVGANSTASKISERYEGGKYAYKEEAIAAIGNATSALARNQWMLGIQQQTKDGGVITAESEVKKLTSAEDRCRGYIQIAFGLLGK